MASIPINRSIGWIVLISVESAYINPDLINSRPGQGAGGNPKVSHRGEMEPSYQLGSAPIRAIEEEAIGFPDAA